MPTTAPKPQGGERVLVPSGTHQARVYKFMNLGTRFQEYKGQLKEYPDTLINISWELPNETHKFTVRNEDGGEDVEVEKPLVISREFTLSMGKKSNLRPIIEGIIGTVLTDEEAYTFDLESILGMTCLVTVSHKEASNGNTYANLVATAPLVKGMVTPDAVNEQVIFDVNTASLDEIDALPDWLRSKVIESDEWKERFDPTVKEKRTEIEEELKKRGVNTDNSSDEEIGPDDIPF